MKPLAIMMVIVMLLSIAGVGWLYLTSTVRVEAIGVVAAEATTEQLTFESLKEQVENDELIGTLFHRSELTESSDYQFLTYTVRLNNNTLLPVDMVELQITPMEYDVLQIGSENAYYLARKSSGDISATILTSIGAHSIRELNITYYIWGIPFTLRTAYGR